jgi:hypothetical protein
MSTTLTMAARHGKLFLCLIFAVAYDIQEGAETRHDRQEYITDYHTGLDVTKVRESTGQHLS